MAKNKRKLNPNRIRSKRPYTLKEVAEVYGKHIRTIQEWRKRGLKVLDETEKPFLILGEEVRRFIREANQKRKISLKPGEFFCPKCQEPRKSLPDELNRINTNRQLGKTTYQVILKGKCEVCYTTLTRFSSGNMSQNSGTLTQPLIVLTDNAIPYAKTDIQKGV